jgi:hypothetical protein
MSKRRNKSKSNIPNPYRLRIDEVKYNINDKRIECVIRYVNPITNNLQISKGVANCNPKDVFDVEVGKHLAEGRAKYNMYRGYREYIDNMMNDVFIKYDKLLKREAVHIQYIINEL